VGLDTCLFLPRMTEYHGDACVSAQSHTICSSSDGARGLSRATRALRSLKNDGAAPGREDGAIASRSHLVIVATVSIEKLSDHRGEILRKLLGSRDFH
jgi:hypothetical protein